MRLLFSALGIIFSCTLIGQTCSDTIACNFNETGDCIYNDSPAVQMASVEYWTLEVDWDCNGSTGTYDLNFFSDNTWTLSISGEAGYYSFCNNTYQNNFLISTPTSTTIYQGEWNGSIISGTMWNEAVSGCFTLTPSSPPDGDVYGCTTSVACNYNPNATIDDGSCEFICYGCTDVIGCNYDSNANVDDGSCEYETCSGCTDSEACNFDYTSSIDNGSCVYPELYLDCFGYCVNDMDQDGICDELEILGCTDDYACNYDPLATDEDGHCEYITCAGCQYEYACNYDPTATIADNESCEYGTCPGCTDINACNYNPTVSEDDGSCEFCSCTQVYEHVGDYIIGENNYDQSGYSVSLSSDGNIIAIGAPENSGNGSSSGHVRVFNWDGSAWTQLGQDIDGEATYDDSGYSVSLSSDGGTVAIGARYNDGNSTNSGHVRIYTWNGTDWTQKGMDIDGENGYDNSGYSVSLNSDGNTIAIGAPNNYDIGHVRIYTWSGNSWTQRGDDIVGEYLYDEFGRSVSISSDGNTVAIGAPENDGNGLSAGHARIFSWNGMDWDQKGQDIDGVNSYDDCGYTVSLSSDGSIVAISSKGNDNNGSNSGNVRIYKWNSTYWDQLGQSIDGDNSGDNSGQSISLSSNGSTIAIGSPFGGDIYNGQVRMFSWDGATWNKLGQDIYGQETFDQIGNSISLSSDGKTVAFGAPFVEINYNTGFVGIYNLDSCAGCIDPAACNYSDTASEDDGSCLYFDECGECGGDGIEEGDCDCDGNQLDALGVCGGFCVYDLDSDGICDNDDDCVGEYDECGVCNGDGIAQDECDCDGNQLDALGVCGGGCVSDDNENGICDSDENYGCTDSLACNYNSIANQDDGSCEYCSCENAIGDFNLELELVSENDTNSTYRLYVTTPGPNYFIASISGDENMPAYLSTSTSFFQSPYGDITPNGINPLFFEVFPELVYDSWVTIGLEQVPEDDEGLVVILIDSDNWDEEFEAGNDLIIDEFEGGGWFTTNTNSNGYSDEDDRVLIAQLTTDGEISAGVTVQILPDNDQTQELLIDLVLGSTGCGCNDEIACNYDPYSLYNDGSCIYQDECGECDGPGAIYECGCYDIPNGDCDCDGNQLDALGVCGGDCEFDLDSDGVCDELDDCVGEYDECGVCNGPGAIYECGCSDIPEGDCDCDGNQLDLIGVCGGDCQLDFNQNGVCDDNEVLGCTYADASNYNELATTDDGSCIYEGTFNDCPSDLNGNGSVGAEDLLLFLADYDTLCDE